MTKKKTTQNEGSELVLTGLVDAMTKENINPEVLEKILDMQERVLDRQARVEFNEKFSDLKRDLKPIVTDSKNDRLNNRYASLSHIQKAIAEPMAKHGFSYRWDVTRTNTDIVATCFVEYRNGEFRSASAFADAEQIISKSGSAVTNKSQATASATSYAKRYSIVNVLGLTISNDDNDCNYTYPTFSSEQVSIVNKLIKEAKADESKMLSFLKVDKLEDALAADFDKLVAMLKQKKAAIA